MPTPTDLVTDLPADFEVFGQAVDTQMKTNADAATQKATLTTKGDIYAATGTSTPARLAVGANGTVLTADSTAATGVAWSVPASGGMTLLSTTTLSGSAVTVSSISGSYKNLAIVVRSMASATPTFPVFSSTSTTFYGFGTYGNTLTNFNITTGNIANSNAETLYSFQMLINDYTNANYKGWSVEGGNNGTTKFVASGMMQKSSAINDITLTSGAGTFSGGTMLIYGVQ
jgi:hypothetical protein